MARKRTRLHATSTYLAIESLEPRHLMDGSAVVATVVSGQLQVAGSLFSDIIDVKLTGQQVLVNSVSRDSGRVIDSSRHSFDLATITSILVTGGSGPDVIRLRADSINTRVDVQLDGGDGDDSIESNFDTSLLTGGNGNDRLLGRGTGVGVDYSNAASGVNVSLLRRVVTVDGSGGEDLLAGISTAYGSRFADHIFGGRAENTINGLEGDDILVGGTSRNYLVGGEGNDELYGDADADLLFGGNGNDLILGSGGDDVVDGGEGNDDVSGGSGADYINGQSGDDNVHGGSGDDYISGAIGSDVLSGDEGQDFLDGGEGADKLFGGDATDILVAGSGEDAVDGGSGDDLVIGGDGADALVGGTGGDILLGGHGADNVTSGAGGGTIARPTSGEQSSPGSGVVQYIDDSTIPGVTPDILDAAQFNAWILSQFSRNRIDAENAIAALKTQKNEIDLSSAKAIREATKRDKESEDAKENAKDRVDEFKEVGSRFDTLTKKADDVKGDDFDELGEQLVTLKKDIDALTESSKGLGLGGFFSKVGKAVSDSWEKAKKGVQDAAGDFLDAGATFSPNAAKAIVKAIRDGSASAKKFVADVKKVTQEGIDRINDALEETLDDISTEFRNAVQGVKDFGVDLDQSVDKIRGGFDQVWTNRVIATVPSFPILQGNGVSFIKGFVEGPKSISDYWTENVERPFNKTWQDLLEPMWHNAEDLWHKEWEHIKGFDYKLWRFLFPERELGPTIAREATLSNYRFFRDEILGEANRLNVVVDGYAGGPMAETHLIDIGQSGEDHSLKNGLAAFVWAVEGEDSLAKTFLDEMREFTFDSTGEPVRLFSFVDGRFPKGTARDGKHDGNDNAEHEDNEPRNRSQDFSDAGGRDNYSIDQFIGQLVGIHFSWKYGNSAVRESAKALMSEWVQVLTDNNGRLGPDDGSVGGQVDNLLVGVLGVNLQLPFLVSDIAEEMGLHYSATEFFAEALDRPLGKAQEAINKYVYDSLGTISWEFSAGPISQTYKLPQDFRHQLADLITSPLTTARSLLTIASSIDKAINTVSNPFGVNIPFFSNNLKDVIHKLLSFPLNVVEDVALFSTMAAGYSFISTSYSVQGPDASATTGHLGFWQGVLYEDLHPEFSAILQPLIKTAQAATAQHRWLNYDLLAGSFREANDKLLDWPEAWRQESYMFKANRADQDGRFSQNDDPQPSLGYLVLHALGVHFGSVR